MDDVAITHWVAIAFPGGLQLAGQVNTPTLALIRDDWRAGRTGTYPIQHVQIDGLGTPLWPHSGSIDLRLADACCVIFRPLADE